MEQGSNLRRCGRRRAANAIIARDGAAGAGFFWICRLQYPISLRSLGRNSSARTMWPVVVISLMLVTA